VTKPVILFLCVHNAGRSQMAAAFARAHGGVTVISAGSEPASSLNTAVVAAMAERGIALGDVRPQKLTDEMARDANVVVTMGCGDACPIYPGKRYVEWEIADPAGRSVVEVRLIRDTIETHVNALVAELETSHISRFVATEPVTAPKEP
jgi:arsenate reductase (thioredoxin)